MFSSGQPENEAFLSENLALQNELTKATDAYENLNTESEQLKFRVSAMILAFLI